MSNIRTTVRVTCHEGTTWATTINGTMEDARAYFLGTVFFEEDCETGRERRMRVVEVVELKGGDR